MCGRWHNLIHYGNSNWRPGNPHNSAQHLSVAAYRSGARVVYINPGSVPLATRQRGRLTLVSPGGQDLRPELQRLYEREGLTPQQSVVVISFATAASLQLAQWARQRDLQVVYRHVDWFVETGDTRYCQKAAQELGQLAQLVCISHPELQQCLPGVRCLLLRNGVDRRAFGPQPPGTPSPGDLHRGALTLGFWGQFWGDRIDWELLAQLASRRRDWHWNLIGNLKLLTPRPKLPENVHFLDYRHPRQLARYGSHFDCGMVPYRQDTALARHSNPIKALEYLACLRPVVSPFNPSLQDYPGVFFYSGPEDAEQAILRAARAELTNDDVCRLMADNSWERVLQRMLLALEESLS